LARSNDIEVVRLASGQRAQAADVLAQAFETDVMYAHLFRDRDEAHRVLSRLFAGVVAHARAFGEVWTTPDLEGAACWVAPGKAKLTLWRALRTGFTLQRAVASFRPQARERFLAGESHVDHLHRQLMPDPHWYLWALGVAPDRQGRGIGGALLSPLLARADAEGMACYLETQTEENVSFYERRGFDVLAADELPGQHVTVPMWYMAREPQK
jgi:ribosomal protein S18 acetylase RimI-like enzyme